MNTSYKRILIVVTVVLLAVVGAAVTFAQDSTTADEASAAGTEQAAPFGGRHGGYAMRFGRDVLSQIVDRDAVNEALAAALGMTVEELEAAHADGQRLPEIAAAQGVTMEDLQAAMQAFWETAVNDALTAGTITQEQADMLLERGMPFAKGGAHGEMRGLMETIFDRDAMHATIAEALGMTVEELEAAHADGQRLPEIAAAQGVTMEEVQTAVEAARTAAIEAAVANGSITQEQADQLLSHPWQPGGHGRHGGGPREGFGGPRGEFGGNGANFQPSAPLTDNGNA